MMEAEKRAELMRSEAMKLLSRAEALENMPVDDFEVGDAIQWQRSFSVGGDPYTYIAIKLQNDAPRQWYMSGRTGWISWTALLENHISRAAPGTVWFASEWEEFEPWET